VSRRSHHESTGDSEGAVQRGVRVGRV